MKRNKIFLMVNLLLIIELLVPLPIACQQGAASPITLRFASTGSATAMYAKASAYWGDLITRRTDGRIRFEYYWAGSLFKAGEMANAIKQGLVETCHLCQAHDRAKMPLWNVTFTVPFGPPKMDSLEKACWKLYEVPELVKDAEKNNVKIIFPVIVESYEIVSKKPLRNLSEMKGVKIAGIGVNLPILGAAGMVPISMPIAERYNALQTGVIEAQFLGIVFSDAFKIQEVAKYVSIIDYGAMIICHNAINRDVWNRIAPQDQKIILEAGREAAKWQSKETDALVDTIIEKWRTHGITVNSLPESDRAIWAARVKGTPWKWGKDRDAQGAAGTEVVKAYFKACEETGYKFPYSTSPP